MIVVEGAEKHGTFKTQKDAKDKACDEGCRPVHVARVRHLQDRDVPDHWRKDPCSGESRQLGPPSVGRLRHVVGMVSVS